MSVTLRGAQYRLEDLASITGASYSQIRRYIREARLPGAVRAGEYSYYPKETLDGIRQVQALFAANLTLRDIHDRLHPEDDDEPAFTYVDDGALG
jgi:DNA-binding transcriptional MerR regulator